MNLSSDNFFFFFKLNDTRRGEDIRNSSPLLKVFEKKKKMRESKFERNIIYIYYRSEREFSATQTVDPAAFFFFFSLDYAT